LTALAVKIALVAAAAALGAYNRFMGLKSLGQDAAASHRFLRVLRIEAAVMLAVLLAATVLGSTSPV
jgi:putative copper resistance protein D